MNLLIVNTHPVNYHVAIYQLLAKQADLNLDVAFLWDVYSEKYQPSANWPIRYEPSLLEGYNSFFIKNYSSVRSGFFEFINSQVISSIMSGKYDAVLLFGYSNLTSWLVALACKIKKIPLIFKGEVNLTAENSVCKTVLKQAYLRTFFKLVSYFTYSYKKNADYYLHYGVAQSKLYFMPCAVNNEYLQQVANSIDRAKVRADLGLSTNKVILFVGKMDARKRPDLALTAFKELKQFADLRLVFVGAGELTKVLEDKCAQDQDLKGRVIFAGFKQHADIYRYLSIADVLVLPSLYDPSPKVVNEAMNFSLPVVVSSSIGTANDLVIDGYNGLVFDVDNASALASKLVLILNDDALRQKLGMHALATMDQWNITADVNCVMTILNEIRLKTHG